MAHETDDLAISGTRNERVLDAWTLVHLATGIVFGWLVAPVPAFLIMALWEPFEIFLLSPLVWRVSGRRFGHEGWRNSMSDLVANGLGVAVGWLGMRALVQPPFVLFQGLGPP